MHDSVDASSTWVLVRADRGLFALSSRFVQEMTSTPEVAAVPNSPNFIRGMINLRGRVMPLVDLRLRFGFESEAQATKALTELLAAREQDHQRWVDELLACVRERRPFTLTTDPHKCAFGKWYDSFKTDNLLLDTVLKRFDEPHRRLHRTGQEVVAQMAKGDCGGCDRMVQELVETTLSTLKRLFAEARAVLAESSREIAVVVRGAGPTFAVAVDGIESVERLEQDPMASMDDLLLGGRSEFIDSVARRAKDGSLVLTVQPQRLLS